MAVKMPKQPFPGGSLGPGWHDYIAQIEKNSETLDSLDARVTASESETISRTELAEGFGRILLGAPTRTNITDITTASDASFRGPTFVPDVTDSVIIYDNTLEAPSGGDVLRVRFKIPGRSNTVDSSGCVALAWLDAELHEIYGGQPLVRDVSNFWVSEARGEFWTAPGKRLRLQVYPSVGSFFVNGSDASTALYGGSLHAYVETEEWAVI